MQEALPGAPCMGIGMPRAVPSKRDLSGWRSSLSRPTSMGQTRLCVTAGERLCCPVSCFDSVSCGCSEFAFLLLSRKCCPDPERCCTWHESRKGGQWHGVDESPLAFQDLKKCWRKQLCQASSDGGGRQLLSDRFFPSENSVGSAASRTVGQDLMENLKESLGAAAARMPSFQPLELPHIWVMRSASSRSRPSFLAGQWHGGFPCPVPPVLSCFRSLLVGPRPGGDVPQ